MGGQTNLPLDETERERDELQRPQPGQISPSRVQRLPSSPWSQLRRSPCESEPRAAARGPREILGQFSGTDSRRSGDDIGASDRRTSFCGSTVYYTR